MLRGGVLFSQSEQMSLNGLNMGASPGDVCVSDAVLVHARDSGDFRVGLPGFHETHDARIALRVAHRDPPWGKSPDLWGRSGLS